MSSQTPPELSMPKKAEIQIDEEDCMPMVRWSCQRLTKMYNFRARQSMQSDEKWKRMCRMFDYSAKNHANKQKWNSQSTNAEDKGCYESNPKTVYFAVENQDDQDLKGFMVLKKKVKTNESFDILE